MKLEPKLELFRRVGKNVSMQRYAKNFTQTGFAERLKLSRTSLALIESGRRGLTLSRLYQIAQVLGIEVHLLLPCTAEVFPTTEKAKTGKRKKAKIKMVPSV
jgi:transcriptional regulator with XRE-family HTH domain